MTFIGKIKKWVDRHFQIGSSTWLIERRIAEDGGGWDDLKLGNYYRVYVVDVPKVGELTEKGHSRLPLCRMKDAHGRFVGRLIVTEVNKSVSLGQDLTVLITAVQAKVVFATAKLT